MAVETCGVGEGRGKEEKKKIQETPDDGMQRRIIM